MPVSLSERFGTFGLLVLVGSYHPSKVILKFIQNSISNPAQKSLAEEQAGFRSIRTTVEQIFNCCIFIEKHLQNLLDLYHNFTNFKKAFDNGDFVQHPSIFIIFTPSCLRILFYGENSSVKRLDVS